MDTYKSIHANYSWNILPSGEFELSSGDLKLFEGYAEAECADGRRMDTRTDRLDHMETSGEGGSEVTKVLFVSDNGLKLTEELSVDKDGIPYAVCMLSDSDDVPVSADMSALLFGTVDFDTWKNAAVCSAYDARKIELRCGEADAGTHDTLPHGAVTGRNVSSSRFVFLYGDDYRDLLEEYGHIINAFTKPVHWKYRTPFGWNSWSAHQSDIDARKADTASAFIKNKLQDRGAVDDAAQVCINLDAGWKKIPEDDLGKFVGNCHRRGQKAGTYDAPFAFFGKDINEKIPFTAGDHTFGEILLRDQHGNLLPRVDGAYPMDVTNPLWQEMTAEKAKRLIDKGYDYIKLDFMSHAGMEGIHYDKKVSTGRQALSLGYAFIRDALSEKAAGRPIFISLSIAPLFPNGYGHARRFSCDAFGCAEDVDYVLNAQTYAWWENSSLYEYNDPDHVCIRKSFCADRGSTFGEARARYTSAVIAGGIMILSEDFSNSEAAERIDKLAADLKINSLAASHKAFRPAGTAGSGACNIFTAEVNGDVYIAIFNLSDKNEHITVCPESYGIPDGRSYTEMWTGMNVIPDKYTGRIILDLNGCDARIIHVF